MARRSTVRAELVDFGIEVVAQLAVATFIACLLGVALLRERGRA